MIRRPKIAASSCHEYEGLRLPEVVAVVDGLVDFPGALKPVAEAFEVKDEDAGELIKAHHLSRSHPLRVVLHLVP